MTTPTTTGPDLLALGEVMRVLVAEHGDPVSRAEHFRSTIGGAEGNVAVGLARLGFRSAWVGGVGDDDAGAYVLRRMRAENVELAGVRVHPDRFTGLLIRNTSAHQAISVSYHRTGSAGSVVDAEQVRSAWAAGSPRSVHVTGITAMLSDAALGAVRELLALAAADRVPVSFDVNLRLRLAPLPRWRELITPLVAQADVLFAGDAELALLADGHERPLDIARRLCEQGREVVVVKNGDHTCTAVTADGAVDHRPLARTVVDPVGAGDALAAGFLAGRLAGLPAEQCLRRACAVAAFAVENWADTDGLPTAADLDQLLAGLDAGQEQVLR